jgi:hypothetical protein
MMTVRVLLAAAGTAGMAYGGWLLLPQVRWTPDYLLSLGGWFGLGPPAHDLLVAPAVALGGTLLARLLPRPWRTSVAAGLVATGVLLLVGLPVLTRPMAAPPNPGLDDRAYLPGLLVFLAVMWTVLLAATAVYAWRRRSGGALSRPRPRGTPGAGRANR